MLFSLKIEPSIPGDAVQALYLRNIWTGPPMTALNEHRLQENQQQLREELAQHFKPQPGVIYNAALAGYQKEYAGEALEALGFRQVMTSRNPNTGRTINLYVRDPIDA